MKSMEFPGGPEVKNLPGNAGTAGSIPDRGTMTPYATGLLTPCATSREQPASHEEGSCVLQPRTKTAND